jgi:hypothetical protein
MNTKTFVRSTLQALALLGFLGAGGVQAQEMCRIDGVNGVCAIAPFLRDRTCSSLSGARYYYGQCQSGRLNGLIALILPPDAVSGERVPSHTLLKVADGVAVTDALKYLDWGVATVDIVNGRNVGSGGCVNWSDNSWDYRKSREACQRSARVFGSESLELPFWREMRSQTVDLKMLSARVDSQSSNSRINAQDDPKVFGRSMRGG